MPVMLLYLYWKKQEIMDSRWAIKEHAEATGHNVKSDDVELLERGSIFITNACFLRPFIPLIQNNLLMSTENSLRDWS